MLNMVIQQMINKSQDFSGSQDRSKQIKTTPSVIINYKGVHNAVQLGLVLLLILASVSMIAVSNSSINKHERYMRTYFNFHLLSKTYIGLYQDGENIDEQQTEIVALVDMAQHLTKVFNVTNSLQQDGFALFSKNNQTYAEMELQNRDNSTIVVGFLSFDEVSTYFSNFQLAFLRVFLLKVVKFRIKIYLGDNKFVQNYILFATYQPHSFLMLNVKLQYNCQPRSQIRNKIDGFRTLQQAIASILFFIYFYRCVLLIIDQNNELVSQYEPSKHINKQSLRKKYRNWYIFLIGSTLIIFLSSKYAPIFSFLQLLPIFEFPQQQQEHKESQMYNFNKNLRFSLPIILTILFQIFIFLNGFILYSMLLYPGQYFDNYFLGFFSYLYQMFQVGTYEIFTQLQSYGNFAYLLYAMLYFYVFLVGNALIPALFVILIQMRITERDIKKYTVTLIEDAVCPLCLQKNSHQISTSNMHIVVMSPKISPLIQRKNLKAKQKSDEVIKMYYIEDDQKELFHQPNKYNLNMKLSKYSTKIQQKIRALQLTVNQFHDEAGLKQCQKLIQRSNYVMSQ